MRDIHTDRPKSGPVPVLSPVLHCIAMPALVYLRSSFGYAFLRPKSFFFACSWALLLFLIYAWLEPGAWSQYAAVCIFAAGATLLYWLHLAATIYRDAARKGVHDHDSGTSHVLPLLRRLGCSAQAAEYHLRFWIEPAILISIAEFLRVATSERHLSTWLFFTALCIVAGEAMNFWIGEVRRKKVASDVAEDAEKQGEESTADKSGELPKATRKEPLKMKRRRMHEERGSGES